MPDTLLAGLPAALVLRARDGREFEVSKGITAHHETGMPVIDVARVFEAISRYNEIYSPDAKRPLL